MVEKIRTGGKTQRVKRIQRERNATVDSMLMTYHSHNYSLINLETHNLAACLTNQGFSDSVSLQDGKNSTHPPIVSTAVTS